MFPMSAVSGRLAAAGRLRKALNCGLASYTCATRVRLRYSVRVSAMATQRQAPQVKWRNTSNLTLRPPVHVRKCGRATTSACKHQRHARSSDMSSAASYLIFNFTRLVGAAGPESARAVAIVRRRVSAPAARFLLVLLCAGVSAVSVLVLEPVRAAPVPWVQCVLLAGCAELVPP